MKNLSMLSLCLLATGCSGSFSQKVVIPKQAVQRSVEGWFPLEYEAPVERDDPAKIILSDPLVIFDPGSHEIGIEMKLKVELPESLRAGIGDGRRAKRSRVGVLPGGPPSVLEGNMQIFFGLRYDPTEAAFYCRDVRVEQLELESLPTRLQEPIRRGAEKALNKYYSENSVYTLEGDGPAIRAAKATLKSVQVEDGNLTAEFGV